MRIGDIKVEPVQPTRTGIYLLRSTNGTFTGIGLFMGDKTMRLPNGQQVPAGEFLCYGPLMFPAQADKVHTTYKIDFVTPTPGNAGGISVKGG